MDYFTLDGIRFLVDGYVKKPTEIGSGIKRALDGTAHRDVAAVKQEFTIDVTVPQSIWTKLYKKYLENTTHLFVDDEGGAYIVMFNEFTITNREQGEDVFYSGKQTFVEV